MIHSSSSLEFFPNIQSKPPLTQLEAMGRSDGNGEGRSENRAREAVRLGMQSQDSAVD